jgi:hypothetical protein
VTSAELRSWYATFNGTLVAETIVAVPVYSREYYFHVAETLAKRIIQLNEVPTPYPIFTANYWPFPDETWADQRFGSMVSKEAYEEVVKDSERFFTPIAAFSALGKADALRCLVLARK